MYKALVLIFVIVAIVVVAYKEYGERDKSNPNYIYKKMAHKIFEMKKIPEKDIYLSSEFKRHLSMQQSEVDTLGFQMQKELDVKFFIDNFRLQTVGEAVDYLRIKVQEKEKRELQKKALQNSSKVTANDKVPGR